MALLHYLTNDVIPIHENIELKTNENSFVDLSLTSFLILLKNKHRINFGEKYDSFFGNVVREYDRYCALKLSFIMDILETKFVPFDLQHNI